MHVVTPTLVAGAEQSKLRKQADAVRATAAQTNYTKIPWVTDIFEGFRLAKEEKRPAFFYMITGDPLGDC
jgi:hypothetical protein